MPLTYSIESDIFAVRNPIRITAAVNPIWASFGSYWVDMQLVYEPDYRSGIFEEVATLREYPDPGAVNVEFTPEAVLKRIVSADPPAINTAPAASLCTLANKRFAVYLREFTDGVQTDLKSTGILHLINAGFSAQQGQYMRSWAQQQKFLSHQPINKRTTKEAPEWLYFIGLQDITNTLYYEAEFTDGTKSGPQATAFSLAGQKYDLSRWPVSFSDLGLGQLAKPVHRWAVWLQNATGDPVSEKRYYYHEQHNCPALSRFYIFEGSLGGWHTLHTSGRLEGGPQMLTFRGQRQLGSLTNRYSRSHYRSVNGRQHQYTQATGYLPPDEAFFLQDLLGSEEAFRIGDVQPNLLAAGDWVPITIISDSAPAVFDDEPASHTFEYIHAQNSQGL